MRWAIIFAILLVAVVPVSALADITGKPRVIDGDTLEIAGERPSSPRGFRPGRRVNFDSNATSNGRRRFANFEHCFAVWSFFQTLQVLHGHDHGQIVDRPDIRPLEGKQ